MSIQDKYNQFKVRRILNDIQPKSTIKRIKFFFPNLHYTDRNNKTLLHLMVNSDIHTNNTYLAIKLLLENGLNPNAKDRDNNIFLQTALQNGFSADFLGKTIKKANEYNFELQYLFNPIMFTAVNSGKYNLDELKNIYLLLDGVNNDKDQLVADCMKFSNLYYDYDVEDFNKFVKKIHQINKQGIQEENNDNKINEIPKEQEINIARSEILELEKYGKILNKKETLANHLIGREKELRNFIITLAEEEKSALIVGPSGVGKTALVEELTYKITQGEVPSFLENKIIYELNPNLVVDQFVGNMNHRMDRIMNICKEHDIIVFIDEIHTLYGLGVGGAVAKANDDAASILKSYIDRLNIKVIGTTTSEEYDKYFLDDALKRRFELINVSEPSKEQIKDITMKKITDSCYRYDISFENDNIKENIIDTLIDVTQKKHRDYYDQMNNPALVLSIINYAFAVARVENSELITEKHFIEGIDICQRLSGTAREEAINRLEKIEKNKERKQKENVIYHDFNRHLKL